MNIVYYFIIIVVTVGSYLVVFHLFFNAKINLKVFMLLKLVLIYF